MATAVVSPLKPFGPRDAGVPMTLDEFDATDFQEGYRYELIHGVLVVSPPPLEEERSANEYLGYLLIHYKESHPEGDALDATLPEQNVRTRTQNRRSDRAIWTGLGRLPRSRGPVSRRDVPSVLVEFPSSRPADERRDYDEKKGEYRDLKVQEYWIIDRFRRTLTVYFWRGSRWTKRVVAENEVYRTPLLPGFELPLARLLAISDRYAGQAEQ